MPGEHEREVRIRLKLESDQASAQAATKGILTDLQAVNKVIWEQKNQWEGVITQIKRYGGSIEEFARSALKPAQQASLQLYLTNKQFGESIEVNTKAMDKYRAAALRGQIANERLGIQFSRTGMAALQSVKAIAQLAAMGDEDFEKVVRAVMKIQLGFQVIAGAGRFIAGISRMWRSYTASVSAAAAAHAALAAAQTASGVTGAGAAGRAAGGVGKGALVGAGVGGAAIGRVGAGIMPWSAAITSSAAALASAGLVAREALPTSYGGKGYGLGGGATPGSLVESIGSSYSNPMAWAWSPKEMWRAYGSDARMAGAEQKWGQRLEARNQRETLEDVRIRRGTAIRGVGVQQRQALLGLMPKTPERFGTEQVGAKAELDVANRRLDMLREEIKLHGSIAFQREKVAEATGKQEEASKRYATAIQQSASAVQQALAKDQSMRESWIMMGRGKRMQFMRAREAAQAGRATPAQLGIIGQLRTPENEGLIRGEISRLEKGLAYKYEEAVGSEYAAKVEKYMKLKVELDMKPIEVSLKFDSQKFGEAVYKLMVPLVKQQEEERKKTVEEAAERAIRDIGTRAKAEN